MRVHVLGGLLALVLVVCAVTETAFAQLGDRRVPSQLYFQGVAVAQAGDFNEAGDLFQREWRGAIKTPTTRWIDSICYHAMMGECHYQMGNLGEALEQYNAALELFNRFPTWMLEVQWPAAGIRVENPGRIRQVPWGPRQRATAIGGFPETMSIQQGRIDNNAVVQQGGVVQQAVQYPIVPQEIVRCTALAIRRRMELLGPAGPMDRLTNETLNVLSGPIAPPGHWSDAWRQIKLGLALAATGKSAQAQQALQRGLLAGGQFDHPLTAVALYELGRLEMQAGRFDQALSMFHEASCLAHHFEDAGLIEECARTGMLAHFLANRQGVVPSLAPIAAWAGRNRFRHVEASAAACLAESQVRAGNLAGGAASLEVARRALVRRDAALGRVGAFASYVASVIAYQQGNVRAGDAELASALAYQQGRAPRGARGRQAPRQGPASLWLFHIQLAEAKFRGGDLSSARDALSLFQQVLREPTGLDWRSSPLESLTVLMTPHGRILEHWFETALARKELPAAVEIADLARRHRFYSTLTRGGRLVALRWVLEAPEEALSQEARLQRQDLLASYPGFEPLSTQARQIRQRLAELPPLSEDRDESSEQGKLLEKLAATSLAQEVILRQMSVARLPCEMAFPPRRKVEDVQKSLGENRALLSYFQTSQRVYGIFINHDDLAVWDVGPPKAVFDRVRGMLRGMGHFEGNRSVQASHLERDDWQKPAGELMAALAPAGRSLLPVDELVIVPDGPLWYLPFEALPAPRSDPPEPLITQTQIRYAPTVGLAVPDGRKPPPLPTTLLTVGQMFSKEPSGQTANTAERLGRELPGTFTVGQQNLPGPGSLFVTLFDRIVTLHDLQTRDGAFAFNPLAPATSRGSDDSLSQWITLPLRAPRQVILPGFHTAAEDALEQGPSNAAGQEIFINSMGMMAAGTQTICLSRWRTGGQASLNFVNEFVRELDHAPPADAFQRAVFLAMDSRFESAQEGRIQAGAREMELSGDHPFFWASLMLIDSGRPQTTEEPAEADPAANLEAEKRRQLLEQLRRQRNDNPAEAP